MTHEFKPNAGCPCDLCLRQQKRWDYGVFLQPFSFLGFLLEDSIPPTNAREFSRLRNCIYRGPAKHAQTSRKWRKHVSSRNKVDHRGLEAQAPAVEREGVCVDIPSRGRHCPKMDSRGPCSCVSPRKNCKNRSRSE